MASSSGAVELLDLMRLKEEESRVRWCSSSLQRLERWRNIIIICHVILCRNFRVVEKIRACELKMAMQKTVYASVIGPANYGT